MKLSSLLSHTAELYSLVRNDSRPADVLIDRYFRSHRYLGSHDRRYIAETFYGILRHRKRLDWVCNSLRPLSGVLRVLDSIDVDAFSLALAYRILIAQDAVDQMIEELAGIFQGGTETASAIVAELVKHSTIRYPNDDECTNIAFEYSFPEWIVKRWIERSTVEETRELCSALNAQAPLTIRVNTVKIGVEECRAALKKEGVETERTRYSPLGLHIQKRMNVFQLHSFRQGYFEMQDEGSQLLSFLLDPKPTAKVVDACAGAGGKSLALASVMKNRGEIYALDVNEYRLQELKKRIKRSGVDTIRIAVINDDTLPSKLIGFADCVLIDAPCSGTGTLRRNPGMKWRITPEMIDELRAKQRRILSLYSSCVKEHGTLLYATCSMMREENEDIVEAFLSDHSEFVLEDLSPVLEWHNLASLVKNKYFVLSPHRHGTDGFFGAMLRKRS